MKKFLKILLIILILIIIVAIVIFNITKHKSSENGNMSNMGLAIKYKGVTYYNKYEKGIFAVKNGTETSLTDETAYSLTIYENKIYYMTIADFNNIVIKYVDLDNGEVKNVMTIYTSISKFYIVDDYIYYFINDVQSGICRSSINGGEETLLLIDNIQDFVIYNNKIFYVNSSNKICSFSLKNQKNIILNNDTYAKKIQIVDKNIYYYNENENALFKIDENGSKNELVSVLINNEIYNVCGKYVYYFDSTNSKICRMKLKKSNECNDIVSIDISKTRINIAGDILYYLDKSTNESQNYQMYRIKTNGDKTQDIVY